LAAYEQAIAEGVAVVGEKDLNLQTARSRLGMLLTALGYPEKDVPYQREALRVSIEALGPEDYDSIAISLRLSDALASLGQFEEALKRTGDALKLLEKIPTTVHEPHARSWTLACNINVKAKQWDNARTLCARGIEEGEKVFGVRSPWFLHSSAGMAELELRVGESAAALARLERLIAIIESQKGNLLLLARAKLLHAEALRSSGQRERAIENAKIARHILADLGVVSAKKVDAADKLIQ
jgi:tetratricopeptide (TPR) repeat protein